MKIENWAKNVTIDPMRVWTPTSFENLAWIVKEAKTQNRKVRAVGSRYSFTDVWVSDEILLKTEMLAGVFTLSQGRNVWKHRPIPEDHTFVLVDALNDTAIASNRRFVHFLAGTKLDSLIKALDHPDEDVKVRLDQPDRGRWSLFTMGGSRGQSFAGAVSTGTHGGDFSLKPIADSIQAISLFMGDGELHWIERSGSGAITDFNRLTSLPMTPGRPRNDHIHYDNDLFNAALVSLGRLGIIYSLVIEVRGQFGLSEKKINTTWNTIRPDLLSGDLFTGVRGGTRWLAAHDRTLASGAPVTPIPRGIGIFINPYRKSDNYDPGAPADRDVMLITHAEANRGFDPIEYVQPPGPSDTDIVHIIKSFEEAGSLTAVRQILAQVLGILRRSEGSRGYPLGYTVLSATGSYQPILSMEIIVSTRGNRDVLMVDRILEVFDMIVRSYWERGVPAKFAGALNLRYTKPSAALLGLEQSSAGDVNERFCHIEIIVLKEVTILAEVHKGHSNMENFGEEWVRHIERAATVDVGARLHWGQLNQYNRARVEALYPDALHVWRRAASLRLSLGNSDIFRNSYTQRCGIEPNTEVLAATAMHPGRYDLFRTNDQGEVEQLWWKDGWNWSNLRNSFPNREHFAGPLAATSWGNNRMDIFGLGKRGTILQLWWGGSWNWSDLTLQFPAVFRSDIPLLGPLAAASPSPGRIELFGLARGGEVWRFWYDSQGWHSANLGNHFPGGERFTGSLTALSWGPDRVDVFGLGTRTQFLQLWRQGGESTAWNWNDLSQGAFPYNEAKIGGPLTAVKTLPGQIDLYCVSLAGSLMHFFWRNGWHLEEIPYGFPLRVARYGMMPDFGRTPTLDETYQYVHERGVGEHFAGALAGISWDGRRTDVFGFGESGDVLEMWRETPESSWNWSVLANRWGWSPDLLVRGVHLDLRLGPTGLRANSEIIAKLCLKDGREFTQSLNNRVEWAGNTRHTFPITVPSDVHLKLGQLDSFQLEYISRQRENHPLDEPHHGTVEELEVYFSSENRPGTLFQKCGVVWAFSVSNPVFALPISIT
jgi:hypothetical protein